MRPLPRLTPAQFRVVAVLWHEDAVDYAISSPYPDLAEALTDVLANESAT